MANEQDFSCDEHPNEYEVRFDVSGTIRLTIMAESLEDAQTKADEYLNDDQFGCELDDVDEINVASVRKTPPMFRVLREGRTMQVSHLKDGDLPRTPTERGF